MLRAGLVMLVLVIVGLGYVGFCHAGLGHVRLGYVGLGHTEYGRSDLTLGLGVESVLPGAVLDVGLALGSYHSLG